MDILTAGAVELDIHPWEFLASDIALKSTVPATDRRGDDIYPPVARACRELLFKRRDVLPQVNIRLLIAHGRLNDRYRSVVGPNMGTEIFLDDAAGRDIGDLPLPRLLSHGRERITTALVERMAQGTDWAAVVLSQMGTDA